MSIRNIGNPYGPGRPAPAAPVKGVASPTTPPSPDTAAPAKGAPAARNDSVQISAAGRALAGTQGVDSGTMSAERVAELRKKVLEGAYNSTQVVDQVAKRILGSGDL